MKNVYAQHFISFVRPTCPSELKTAIPIRGTAFVLAGRRLARKKQRASRNPHVAALLTALLERAAGQADELVAAIVSTCMPRKHGYFVPDIPRQVARFFQIFGQPHNLSKCVYYYRKFRVTQYNAKSRELFINIDAKRLNLSRKWFSQIFPKFSWKLTNTFDESWWIYCFGALQACANHVDLETYWKLRFHVLRSVLIRPRTSLPNHFSISGDRNGSLRGHALADGSFLLAIWLI